MSPESPRNNPNKGAPATDDAWVRLVGRGILLPEVTTLAEYQSRFLGAYPGVVAHLMQLNADALVSLETTLEVHRMLFGNLYKEAGVLRRKAVTAGVSMPADPSRIKSEWELLRMELPQVLGATASADSLIATAAFFHVRAKCIQPVNDGNKRSTRLQASVLLAQTFGKLPDWSFEPGHADYYEALRSAQRAQDLTPMINILRRNFNLAPLGAPVPSPFRVRPFLINPADSVTAQTSAADLFERARREGGPK